MTTIAFLWPDDLERSNGDADELISSAIVWAGGSYVRRRCRFFIQGDAADARRWLAAREPRSASGNRILGTPQGELFGPAEGGQPSGECNENRLRPQRSIRCHRLCVPVLRENTARGASTRPTTCTVWERKKLTPALYREDDREQINFRMGPGERLIEAHDGALRNVAKAAPGRSQCGLPTTQRAD